MPGAPAVLDLLIVGAGPAGCAAAIEASRAGLSAVVIDKARFPRDKCCGDGLTAGGLRQLAELGLDPADVPSWKAVGRLQITAPDGEDRVFPLPQADGLLAATARRTELDAALVARARAVGAEVGEGLGLESIELGSNGTVTAVAGGRRFTARQVIAADGMWSPTRRLLGLRLPRYRGDWHAFRQYFHGVSPGAAAGLHVWFERDLLPGYAWSFPLSDGSVNVGFGIRRGNGRPVQEMKALWTDILARPHIRSLLGPSAAPEGRHRAWPIPARLGEVPLTHGQVMFVGDAAAAADPLTGEGIAQALETGRLAVACLVAADGDGPAAARRYEATLRAGMIKDHRMGGAVSRVVASATGVRWSVRVAGSTRWTRRNFARWLFEDYPRAVIGTPARWHRSAFAGDRAFGLVERSSAGPTVG